MKPKMMTTFGWPTGNCFAACMASVLEVEIDELPCGATPALLPGEEVGAWIKPWNAWLAQRGLELVSFDAFDDKGKTPPWSGYAITTCRVLGAPTMADGTELCHCVVSYNGAMEHDPQPNGDISKLWPYQVSIFVATHPHLAWHSRVKEIADAIEPSGVR